MNENVRIARQLLRLAKMIAAAGEEKTNTSIGQLKKDFKENVLNNPQGFMKWLSSNRSTKVKDYATQTETLVQLFDHLLEEYQAAENEMTEEQ